MCNFKSNAYFDSYLFIQFNSINEMSTNSQIDCLFCGNVPEYVHHIQLYFVIRF